MERITLAVDGMSCAHCLNAVRNALSGVGGTEVESVRMGMAVVSYDPHVTSPRALADAVSDEGYTASVLAGDAAG